MHSSNGSPFLYKSNLFFIRNFFLQISSMSNLYKADCIYFNLILFEIRLNTYRIENNFVQEILYCKTALR